MAEVQLKERGAIRSVDFQGREKEVRKFQRQTEYQYAVWFWKLTGDAMLLERWVEKYEEKA